MAWALANGSIPAGMVVRHYECRNPRCCRPDHLRIGTQKQNGEDMVRDGHSLKGARNPRHVFTDAEILAIRDERARGRKTIDIARDRSVSNSLVSQICRGKLWQHLLPADFVAPSPCKPRGWNRPRPASLSTPNVAAAAKGAA